MHQGVKFKAINERTIGLYPTGHVKNEEIHRCCLVEFEDEGHTPSQFYDNINIQQYPCPAETLHLID